MRFHSDKFNRILTSMFMHSILLVIFYMVDISFCQVVNVAKGKPAEQSSTLHWAEFNWTADKAVDGCLRRDGKEPDNKECCSATTGGNSSWKLNLTRQYHVQMVDIYARTGNPGGNQLDGFEFYIIEAADGDEQLVLPVNSTNNTFTFTFPLPRNMTEVIIRRTGILTLCEVQVFAVCNDGTYGENCTNFCGQCRHNSACNKTTGDCLEGCQAGFSGVLCNESCENGKWGLDCRNSCSNCLNETVCHFENGDCPSGCEAGWEGDRCDTECQGGTWGQNCSSNCGNCIGNMSCHHISGECGSLCKAGWQGSHCVNTCRSGDWGQNCSYRCGNCLEKSPCQHVHGACLRGCEKGWQGAQCVDERQNGTWGQNCSSKCGNCISDDACNHVSGVCGTVCDVGWQGSHCFSRCQGGTWGQNCSYNCGNCLDNSPCHHINGTCLKGCETGWIGINCVEASMDKDETTTVIGGVIGGVFAAVIVCVAVLVLRKRSKSKCKKVQEDNLEDCINPVCDTTADRTDCDSVEYKDSRKSMYKNIQANPATVISVSGLRQFCRTKCVANSSLQGEFADIPYGLQYECKDAVSEQNKKKNRYKDMYPYDKNRVKLPSVEAGLNPGYINASYIEGYASENEYIASQGVMENTINDFWWMVWSQNVYNIIMLTQCHEAGRLKCYKYWPESGERTYGNISVTIVHKQKNAEFIIRSLLCKYNVDQTQRSITQFHYTAWPDKDVPDHPLSLVQFWRKVKLSDGSNKRPWLVHCSAGVGRTGTFIALDGLYQQAKAEKKININSCVRSLREQRVNMVQTAAQYFFLHQTVLEAIQPIGRTCRVDEFPDLLADLQRLRVNSSRRNLEIEFEQLQCDTEELMMTEQVLLTSEDDYENIAVERCADSKLPENIDKSRDRNILPYDQYRPWLTTAIVGRNDYINAVLLQTYLQSNGLIITQTPLPSTVVDFLRLVWDNYVTTIVMMHDDRIVDNVGAYWQTIEEPKDLKTPFVVTVSSKTTEKLCTKREIELSFKGEVRHITQFQFNDWPDGNLIPESTGSLLQFLYDVGKCHDGSTETPLVVHCMNGADRSGLFCVLWTIMERLKDEKEVAVAETIKAMKFRRPQIIPNQAQYKFCHETVHDHLKMFELYANFL